MLEAEMSKTMSPNAPQNERKGEEEAVALFNQAGRQRWNAKRVRDYGDAVYCMRTQPGTSTAENEMGEGFRRMAYIISQTRNRPGDHY